MTINKRILVCLLVLVIFIMGCSGISQEAKELEKANLMIADSEPHKQYLLDEVKAGRLTTKEIEIYQFAKKQYNMYIAQSGGYDGKIIDPIVELETAQKFNISEEEGTKIFFQVDGLRLGLKP